MAEDKDQVQVEGSASSADDVDRDHDRGRESSQDNSETLSEFVEQFFETDTLIEGELGDPKFTIQVGVGYKGKSASINLENKNTTVSYQREYEVKIANANIYSKVLMSKTSVYTKSNDQGVEAGIKQSIFNGTFSVSAGYKHSFSENSVGTSSSLTASGKISNFATISVDVPVRAPSVNTAKVSRGLDRLSNHVERSALWLLSEDRY